LTNSAPQLASKVVQLANSDSLLLAVAHDAIASALSSSCDAVRPCTSRALASMEKPRLAGSANTVATGATPLVSWKRLRIVASNWGADRRQILRGPGTAADGD